MATDTTTSLERLVAAEERRGHRGAPRTDTDGPREEYFLLMASSSTLLHLKLVGFRHFSNFLFCFDVLHKLEWEEW